MTGLKGNSEFCLFVCEAEENIEVDGKQNSLFSAGPLIKCLGLVIPPNSKLGKKNCEEIVCFTSAGSQICRGFKEHDLVTCESKVHVVVSLRELASFDPRQMTRSSNLSWKF